jgi:hypothetical protein
MPQHPAEAFVDGPVVSGKSVDAIRHRFGRGRPAMAVA